MGLGLGLGLANLNPNPTNPNPGPKRALWWIMPGMHVRVVNSYDAASEKMPGEGEAEAEACV